MLITDYLKKECIIVDLKSNTKEEMIEELAEPLFQFHPEVDRKEALAGLHEREKLLSTGIGNGIAIPHTQIESSKEISVAFGIMHSDLDFDTLDKKPVRIVVLILFPKDNVSLQLRFLARVSRLLQHASLNESLYECQNPEEVIDTFKHYEEKHFH